MAFIGSILLGTSLVRLQSPLFFEVLRRTLTKGFWAGALLSLGGFIAYFAILMTFLGTYQILLWDSIRFLLFLIGGIVLLNIGLGALKMKEKDILNIQNKKMEKYIIL